MHNAHIYLHIWLIDSYLYKNASKFMSSSGIAHIYIANIYENKRILLGHRNLKFGVGVWIYFICDIPNSIMHKLIHLNQTYLFLNHVFHTLNQDDFRPRLKIVLTKKWARASSNFIWKIDSTTPVSSPDTGCQNIDAFRSKITKTSWWFWRNRMK